MVLLECDLLYPSYHEVIHDDVCTKLRAQSRP